MKLGPITFLERRPIGLVEEPLLIRYILFRLPAFGIYVHHLLRSDFDRALHDHPWPFVSIMLRGGYTEIHDQTLDGKPVEVQCPPGTVLLRPAEWRHRIVMPRRGATAWTLVLVGRRQRRWGFWLKDGWCWWRQHNPLMNICEDVILWTGGSD